MRWHRALVTGASAGIGAEVCRAFAERGTAVVLVGRDHVRLRAVAEPLKVATELVVADLATPHGRQQVSERLGSQNAPIDVLINNAAIGASGWWDEIEPSRNVEMIETNVVAVQELLDAFLGATFARPEQAAALVNVASGAAVMPRPRQAVYAATKAYMLSLSESLHDQCAVRGVHVSCVLPGFTRTEFHQLAGYRADDFPPGEVQFEPSDVAAAILEAADRNTAVVKMVR
ncbi:MAG: SDR family NAD(P)-dependent oxidoreductase [Actinomycetota bacterium]